MMTGKSNMGTETEDTGKQRLTDTAQLVIIVMLFQMYFICS